MRAARKTTLSLESCRQPRRLAVSMTPPPSCHALRTSSGGAAARADVYRRGDRILPRDIRRATLHRHSPCRAPREEARHGYCFEARFTRQGRPYAIDGHMTRPPSAASRSGEPPCRELAQFNTVEDFFLTAYDITGSGLRRRMITRFAQDKVAIDFDSTATRRGEAREITKSTSRQNNAAR